jgi:hypothetical protein
MEGKMMRTIIAVLLLIVGGCSGNMEDQVDLLTTFDFESGDQLWTGGISDFPVAYEDDLYFLMSTEKVTNSSFLDESSGLNVSGENPHGDLFYYFSRKVGGLIPNSKYKLDYEFLVYAQLLEKPDKLSSEELYLKVGAVNYEPELEKVLWRNSLEYKALNIDKGEFNSDGGEDMINIGSIREFTSEIPEVVSGNTFDQNFEVVSNNAGEIWIMIGVDSGIKSKLTFGIEALTVYFRQR